MATIANLAAKVSADGSGFERVTGQVVKQIGSVKKAAEAADDGMKPGGAAWYKDMEKNSKKLHDNIRKGPKPLNAPKLPNLDKHEKSAARLTQRVNSLANAFSGLKALAVASAVAIAAQFISGTVGKAVDEFRIARRIGVELAALKGLQQALRDVGSPAEDAADVLGNLSRTIAAGLTGDTAVNDAFHRLGGSVQQLADMAPDEALKQLADRFKAMPDPMQRAALATQLFGDKAASILPVLMQGRAGLEAATKRATLFGVALSDVDASRLEMVQNLIENIEQGFIGITLQIASQVIPFLQAVAESLGGFGDLGADVAEAVKIAIYWVMLIGAAVAEAVKVLGVVFKFAEIGFRGIATEAAKEITKILAIAAQLPDELGGAKFRAAFYTVSSLAAEWAGGTVKACEEQEKAIGKLGDSFGILDKWYQKVLDRGTELENAAKKKRTADTSVPKAMQFADQFREAMNITAETMTPLQRFQERMTKIDFAINSGAISWDTYSRAAANAVGELEKAHELQSLALPTAIKANTTEAASAINRDRMLQDNRFREKPEDRVRRVLEQSKKIEEDQLIQQRKIADGVAKQQVVRF